MKESELRLGNLLQDGRSKAILIVCRIEIGIITTIVKDREKYPLADGWYNEPIPLNEEWLIRLGFKKITPKGSIYQLGKFHIQDFSPIGIYESRNHIKLDYVHQLQNLYFTLTGSELPSSNIPLP